MHPHLHLPQFPPTLTHILFIRQDSMMAPLALRQNAKVSALQHPHTLIRIPTLVHMVLHLQNVHQRLPQSQPGVQESAARLYPLLQ
jgi:hypothetical protein